MVHLIGYCEFMHCAAVKLAFLKALTLTKDFTDNTEFNKYRSRLVATLE